MRYISKDIFLNTIFCPTLGWRLKNESIQEELSPGTLFRMEQGKEIGRLARELHPDGIPINESDSVSSALVTHQYLDNPKKRVLFEATFLADNYVAKADIILQHSKGWDLIEVKSSVNQNQEHIDDMAYTTLVALKSGFRPSKIFLQILDKNYRLEQPLKNLFTIVDCTTDVFERADEFSQVFEEVHRIVTLPDEPEVRLTFKCKQCEYFERCVGEEIKEHIFHIPRLSQKNTDLLIARGIVSIHDIPHNFPLTGLQKQTVECIKCGTVSIDVALREKLEEIHWPAYYLDFETTMTAIPLFADLAPYDKFPTQYSIHLCDRCGHILEHRDYLADPSRDCRRELAEKLIQDLQGEGSIISYSSFEKTVISGLCTTFPDLEKELLNISERLVDLEKCVKCVQHPQFLGRTSIKVVLPALVPDLSYEGLEIADGDTAMVTYALMAKGMMGQEEMEQKRAGLLEYCMLDTLAMVRLHEKLSELMNDQC
jgi:CRISPR/Cas system-associated exonuclease Cas4 (RecB family)